MSTTQTTEKAEAHSAEQSAPRSAVGIRAGGWEEKAAVRGELTFGQTREVLAAIIEQRDELLSALKEVIDDIDRGNGGYDCIGSARRAIAKAEGAPSVPSAPENHLAAPVKP